MDNEELLLPTEWEKRQRIRVMDPDGWDYKFQGKLSDGTVVRLHAWDEPISEEEFNLRAAISIIDMSPRGLPM